MTSGVIVRMEDCRAAELCARGVRAWFATHGLDFNEFLTNGMPASLLRARGDALCEQVIAIAEARDGE